MWLDRKLIDYLPPVLQQTREMQAVMEGEQPAVAGLWDAWKTVLDALFVRYANEQGLARWERMLGIRPRGTDSMEVRRVAVLARLNEQLPFTERTLRLMLDGVCGPGGYTLEIIYREYRVFVRVHLWEKRAMDEAADEQATVIMLAQAEAYETADRQNTDALLALAEVYETMIALQTRVEALEGGEQING